MKKIFITAIMLGAFLSTNAQILSNGIVTQNLLNTNYFLDASNFQGQKDASVGKLLGFPKTDLTKFKFNLDVVTDEVVLSGFDGVVVYNMAKGTTGSDAATQGKQVAVTPGFYYFSNPNGAETQSVANGQWVRLGADAVAGTTLGTLPKYTTVERDKLKGIEEGTLIYNTTTKQVEVYNGTDWVPVSGVATTNPGGGTPVSPGTGVTPPGGGSGEAGGGNGRATMAASQDIYIASIKDNKVDYQGVINNGAHKITFSIPYTSGNNGSYNNVAYTVNTEAGTGENNDQNQLKLKISSGTFSSTGGTITGEIEVLGDGTFNVKKQSIPTSAEDFKQKQMEVAQFNFKLGDMVYTLNVKGISGIPDRCYGKTTLECVGYGANEKEHDFVYIPITGPDGKTWLNNNLGAEYARVGSPHFNPVQQATSKTDWKAYGSLFQWQRNPDGHELINWSSSTSGAPKYTGSGSISNSWTNAGTNQFIPFDGSSSYGWVNNTLNGASTQKDLWQSGGTTNPCPSGYHVPTHTEQMALHDAITGKSNGTSGSNSNVMWNETVLRLPASGFRGVNGGDISRQVTDGNYWSSKYRIRNSAWYLYFNSNSANANHFDYHTLGFSVRCLKD
ncbi:FISUMP domain-containing protein [Ornithobacterium rhinotracheale]|uniref:FISUMP domain-containing protein n=5 Tax=Ornithobacterium rhinotracheale TaxID=28251 RepID=UPI003FA45CE7